MEKSVIDCSFDFYSDTPTGKDPDQHSPTLKKYHKLLWSKPLPNGELFQLDDTKPNTYLHHKSRLGEFTLGSDAITHSYRNTKRIAHILNEVPKSEIDELFKSGSTIGAYTIFPSKKVDNKI